MSGIDKRALDRWILSTQEEAYPHLEDESEGFELYYCLECSERDTCTIHPSKYLDECPRYHSSGDTPT